MNTYSITNIAVCTDCIMLIANGDGDDAHADVMSDQWPNHHFGYGGDPDDDADFAWIPCEGCGSTLGGSRHAAHVWPTTNA